MLDESYEAPKPWIGRCDATEPSRLHEIIRLIDLEQQSGFIDGFALLGFCCDEGVIRNKGRKGAALAPDILRAALANIPLQEKNISLCDAGNILCLNGQMERAQEALAEAAASLQRKKMRTIVLGGGHETAWGHFQAVAAAHPGQAISIINIDAHFDLRPLADGKGNSGTPFLQIASFCKENGLVFDYTCIGIQPFANTLSLFHKAEELGCSTITAEQIYYEGNDSWSAVLDRLLAKENLLYLSLDLDVFASAYAPGVSAPQPLGIAPWQLIPLLRSIGQSEKLIAVDVVELCPPYDQEGRTAALAAHCIAALLYSP